MLLTELHMTTNLISKTRKTHFSVEIFYIQQTDVMLMLQVSRSRPKSWNSS